VTLFFLRNKNCANNYKDINMNFGLEKCAGVCLKRGRVQSKMHIRSTFGNGIEELDPRKALSI
jgi:hypothetical protein